MSTVDSAPREPSFTRLIPRMLNLAWEYRRRTVQVFALQCVLLGLTLSGMSGVGLAVDVIRAGFDPKARPAQYPFGWTEPGSWSVVVQLLAIAVVILLSALAAAGLNYWYQVSVGRLVHVEIVPSLRRRVFTHLQQLSFRFFDRNASGAIVNRVTVDIQMLRSFVDGVVIQGAVLVLALSVFLAYMLSAHVRLTLVGLTLTPILYVVTTVFSRWARPAYQRSRKLADEMVRTMAEGIEGIQVTRIFGREEAQIERFEEKNRDVRRQQFEIFGRVSRFAPTVDLINQLNVVILLGYGGLLVSRGEVTLGQLVVFVALLRQFASRASGMADIVNVLQQSLTGARRVFEVLDARREVEDPANPRELGRLQGAVSLRDVSFGYEPGKLVLEGLRLDVRAGECIGIFGTTGSGKSTLLSLIPRFYDASTGSIEIDQLDVRELSIDALRRQVGVVFQETWLCSDTIANNIAYGDPEASPAAVERAARLAGAHGFISELPLQYQTWLDEGGRNLSGGQRQRLAIARALLHDPRILLLDDPLAAVDATTEHEILSAIGGAIQNRTTFLVSNRISALRRADRIVILDRGRMVDVGTHHELLRRDGPYRRVAQLMDVERSWEPT